MRLPTERRGCLLQAADLRESAATLREIAATCERIGTERDPDVAADRTDQDTDLAAPERHDH